MSFVVKSRSGLEFNGFESEKELLNLVFQAKIIGQFQEWMTNDRSKAGLLALGKRPEFELPCRNERTEP